MIAFMPIVFRILINKNYYSAIYYVPILLLATYFANISGFYGGIFTAYKDTKIMGTTTVVAAIINLGVNIAMIRIFGIYAAAISTLVANFTVYIYRRIKVGKYIKYLFDECVYTADQNSGIFRRESGGQQFYPVACHTFCGKQNPLQCHCARIFSVQSEPRTFI